MNDADLVIALGGLISILISVLAWIGNRVHTRLDKLTETVDSRFLQLHEALITIDRDLRADLSDHGERIARIEARCTLHHKG